LLLFYHVRGKYSYRLYYFIWYNNIVTSTRILSGEIVLSRYVARRALNITKATFNGVVAEGGLIKVALNVTIGHRTLTPDGSFGYTEVLCDQFGDEDLAGEYDEKTVAIADLTARIGMTSSEIIALHPEFLEDEEYDLHGGVFVPYGELVVACCGTGDKVWDEFFAQTAGKAAYTHLKSDAAAHTPHFDAPAPTPSPLREVLV
jgi:hypothetical protein